MAEPKDALDKLADDIKAAVIKACAKAAEIYFISRPENEFQRGYDTAAREIAARIKSL